MIDSLKQKGAGYFVVCDADVEGLRANAMLYSHLTSTYLAIIDRNGLMVFSLARK
jgi:5S rRNA maturation endonuclease (ribonuclease M5)